MFVVAAVLLIGTLSAEPPKGRLLAAQCFQCHGTNGQAVGGFESISGKSATEMFEELWEMSTRRPEGIMDLQARAFTRDQLRWISDYLATLAPGVDDGSEERENGMKKEDEVVEKVKAEKNGRNSKKRGKNKSGRNRTNARTDRR